MKTYEKSLADARANASGIARETRDRLSAEVDKERASVEAETASKLTEAEARIAATKRKALSSVNEIADVSRLPRTDETAPCEVVRPASPKRSQLRLSWDRESFP